MNQPTLLIGAAILAGLGLTTAVIKQQPALPADSGQPIASAEYGLRLIRHTSREMGIGQPDPALRYAGNNLDCSSCHLDSGQQPGMLSLLESASKYPTFSARDGIMGDLADRINGCMQRSMAGLPLEKDSVQMQSMVLWIEALGERFAAMSPSSRAANDPPPFAEPARQADLEHGARVYVERCQVCHGSNGEGLRKSTDPGEGYLFPPLWGPDSYNIGAGMARVLTAARFIKARMPLGAANLTDAEAYDVAAWMNAQPRPDMADLERDYPELRRKPVDSPYPPYADPFPVEQHRLGPFAPIRAYYE